MLENTAAVAEAAEPTDVCLHCGHTRLSHERYERGESVESAEIVMTTRQRSLLTCRGFELDLRYKEK